MRVASKPLHSLHRLPLHHLPQATTALGCAIMALGVFLSSFAPNLITFMLTYAVMFGTGVGLAYTAPMVNGWKWFPNKKGLVSGAVVAGFGSGGFVFNQARMAGWYRDGIIGYVLICLPSVS